MSFAAGATGAGTATGTGGGARRRSGARAHTASFSGHWLLAGVTLAILGGGIAAVLASASPPPTPVFADPPPGATLVVQAPFTIIDQVAPSQIPVAPIAAATASWGIPFVAPDAAGTARCGQSAPGEIVVCVHGIADDRCPCWSKGLADQAGIYLDPRLVGAPAWEVQEAVCHETAVEIDATDETGGHDCTDRAMAGYLNPPEHFTPPPPAPPSLPPPAQPAPSCIAGMICISR